MLMRGVLLAHAYLGKYMLTIDVSLPPDKFPEEQRAEAHVKFQRVAFANAILSDPARRKRYDTTGSTAESVIDADGFNWSDYYREQYANAINADSIRKFADQYKGSDEEKDDVLVAYEKSKGKMDAIYESVMLSNVLEDDERFRKIIDEAIESGDVKAYKAYANESQKSKNARVASAKGESNEAEEYAKELGVHDKLFGANKNGGAKGKGKGKASKSKENAEDSLAALIRGRQKERGDAFLDALAEKYGANTSTKKSKKKQQVEEEPDEEAFQAAAAKLGKKKNKATEDPAPKATKKSRR